MFSSAFIWDIIALENTVHHSCPVFKLNAQETIITIVQTATIALVCLFVCVLVLVGFVVVVENSLFLVLFFL